jgi:3-deoxy-D-manno-octulosonic acid kinase
MGLPDILASDIFESRTTGRMRFIVRREGADGIAQALGTAENCTVMPRAERGALRSFAWRPDRQGLVRVCHRGGAVACLLGEKYLLWNRPGQEFAAHWLVEQRGLPVPRVLGILWERRGPWVSGALATELLPGPDLLAWLRAHDGGECSSERTRMLQSVGGLVRDMHQRGVWHADLQVKNIVIADGLPHLIDLDRAVVGRVPGRVQCCRNLLRFRRSLQKNAVPEACYSAFMDGYGGLSGVSVPVWLDMAYRLRGKFSESMRGKRT